MAIQRKKSTAIELDKTTSALMYFFIWSLNGVLGKTHLQKLMFLSDLLASKKFKTPISKMNYIRYTHGPYCRDFDSYIEKLTKDKLIEERVLPMFSDPSKTYSRFYINNTMNINIKKHILSMLGQDKAMLLDEVVQSYGNKSLQEVLDFVYSLEEVKDAQFESPIDMAKKYTSQASDDEELDDIPF